MANSQLQIPQTGFVQQGTLDNRHRLSVVGGKGGDGRGVWGLGELAGWGADVIKWPC